VTPKSESGAGEVLVSGMRGRLREALEAGGGQPLTASEVDRVLMDWALRVTFEWHFLQAVLEGGLPIDYEVDHPFERPRVFAAPAHSDRWGAKWELTELAAIGIGDPSDERVPWGS
jgi:hypothetical protein